MNNADLVAITMATENEYPVANCGNLRLDPNVQLGTAYYHMHYNEAHEDYLFNYLNEESIEIGSTIVIDAEILKHDRIMEAIKRKVDADRNYYGEGDSVHRKLCIRIQNEGYTLTQEDYEKIQYFDQIIVDNCDENILRQHNNITVQSGIYKLDYQEFAQPVIERRTHFDDTIIRNVYHVNHRLTDKEFDELITNINNDSISSIELNLYDQSYYETFFSKLREHHVKDNINIRLIGYPLEDYSVLFRRLQSFPYEIDIQYSLCHDMVNQYEQEPYTENKLLYSRLEGGGITSLNNYVNVLALLEEFQRDVEKMNLSPLEIAIYAKMKIDEEYIYDPDFENADTDEWDNVNLSQMINHEVEGKKRAICLGFSTLYSALLRKGNVPLFRDSARGHSKNIGRIKDDKYGVDTIATFDITYDLESTVGDISYTNFGLAPRTNLNYPGGIVNIETTLSLPYEELQRVELPSIDIYELFYHPFSINPLGYLTRMLELVGYIPENLVTVDIYDYIYRLYEEGRLEGIDRETLMSAAREVLHKRTASPYDESHYLDRMDQSIEERQTLFSSAAQLEDNVTGNPNYVETINPENISQYRDRLMNNPNRPIFLGVGYENENNDMNDEMNLDTSSSAQNEEITPTEPIPEETRTPETQNEDHDTNSSSNVEIDDPVTLELGESSEELIPGTNIHRPRRRGDYESDEEYVAFLEKYYNKYFPNAEYVRNVLNYCQEKNMNLYHYYFEIGNLYRKNQRNDIPEFERENPFLSDNDIEMLISYQDDMALVYFANSMMQTIGLNISDFQRYELETMFTNPEDHYNAEIARSR